MCVPVHKETYGALFTDLQCAGIAGKFNFEIRSNEKSEKHKGLEVGKI